MRPRWVDPRGSPLPPAVSLDSAYEYSGRTVRGEDASTINRGLGTMGSLGMGGVERVREDGVRRTRS